jgi:hypothetical protein
VVWVGSSNLLRVIHTISGEGVKLSLCDHRGKSDVMHHGTEWKPAGGFAKIAVIFEVNYLPAEFLASNW